MKISLIAAGPDLVGEELAGLAARARDGKPVLERIQRFLLEKEGEQFETHGARTGHPWPQDSQEWQDRKAKMGHPTEPEENTEALRHSLTRTRAPGSIRRLSKQKLTIGSRLPQAVNARRPPGRGRQRREVDLIAFTTDDLDHVGGMIIDYLLGGEL